MNRKLAFAAIAVALLLLAMTSKDDLTAKNIQIETPEIDVSYSYLSSDLSGQ